MDCKSNLNFGQLSPQALYIYFSKPSDQNLSIIDMLLVSTNPSDFHICSCGVVAVESFDDAGEFLATEVRLGSCRS